MKVSFVPPLFVSQITNGFGGEGETYYLLEISLESLSNDNNVPNPKHESISELKVNMYLYSFPE